MKHYPVIIFDWDGTLIDSIERIVTSLQHASKVTTGANINAQQARDVIGLGLDEAISKLHPEIEQTALNPVINAYKQHFIHENTVAAPLFPGVRMLLQTLIDMQLTLAIATGKSRQGLDYAITEHNVAHFFTTTRCAGEYLSKPHPDMLLSILDELKVKPSQALMVGDSEHDLLMAKRANVDCIGVTHGVQTAATLMQFDPLFCLDNITDLPKRLLQSKIG